MCVTVYTYIIVCMYAYMEGAREKTRRKGEVRSSLCIWQ